MSDRVADEGSRASSDPVVLPGSLISRADSTDWPQQVAGMIVDGVGSVRDKTTGRVITAARWAVYGLLAALLGFVIMFLVVIASVRVLTEFLQWATGEQDIVWLTYLIIGGVSVAAGTVLWSMRKPR